VWIKKTFPFSNIFLIDFRTFCMFFLEIHFAHSLQLQIHKYKAFTDNAWFLFVYGTWWNSLIKKHTWDFFSPMEDNDFEVFREFMFKIGSHKACKLNELWDSIYWFFCYLHVFWCCVVVFHSFLTLFRNWIFTRLIKQCDWMQEFSWKIYR